MILYGATLASMMPSRLGMALVLTSILVPVSAQERTLQEQAKKIRHGSKVMVQLKNRNTVFGRLVGVTDSNLTLELATPNGSRRDLLFQDVSSIRHVREMPRPIEAIAAVPVIVICGIESIFDKNACAGL
jgi:small nuclear ribonucleoprotein (snRNP)-like protein